MFLGKVQVDLHGIVDLLDEWWLVRSVREWNDINFT
jgi:hypothetical protein